ncbi:diacylglycerol kinase theta-like [Periophthalmus magnuspinnatus]|uniref:diacylglycerol kinase theta-like n=1 Tax=Periophthalmus magnuspinnatus TaxID=409849 RepID=UPI00145B83CB|nr:diacylglycerol kinase theta-like [Periophthalmus magnuspinnatus]
MADSTRIASPLAGKRRGQQPSPSLRPRLQNPSSGHSFKKVTLTKPTFCHSCSEFIWGLAGYLCEVCNFMSHEKCLKTLRSVCSCLTPTIISVPVAHCLLPAGHKKRFCSVCRKPTGGSTDLRCEVCELHVHSDCAVFSCADCRCSHMDSPLQFPDTWPHHWREGCASSSCRCEVCRRSCGSSDVLTGLRCEWCGITSHGTCFVSVPPECTLGRFRTMILDPRYVQLESRNFSKMHLYRVQESSAPEQDTSDEVDVSLAVIKDGSTAAADSGRHFLKVFDGDDAVKRGSSRTVSVSKATNNEEVVEAALRAYYLPDDPLDFELQEVNLHGNGHQGLHAEGGECGAQNDSSHSEEDILNRNGLNQNQEQPEDRGETWVLRAKPKYSEVLKVYQEWERSESSFLQVSVAENITVAVLLNEVLGRLGRQGDEQSSYSLQEVYMNNKQVMKQTLGPKEKILDKVREIRKVSLRQMHQTRLYVVENRRSEVNVELLIGGLPTVLDTKEYTHLLEEHLAIKSNLVSIYQIYGAQGWLSLQISCFSEAERIFMLAKDTTVSNKQLSSLVCPQIQVERLCPEDQPLLVFVNPKSGGLKGRELLHGFRKILNPHQVFDISHGGPLPGLHVFRCVPRFRVLVCGGDGSVGWVLSVLETIRHKMVCREPPLAILPLGTGNDLSRVLRWGAGYSAEPPLSVLQSVEEAEEVLMDRWTILLDAQDLSQTGTDNGYLEPPKIVQMNNYFGLGIDAELSLDFHLAREDDPDKFTSRFHNKGVYVKVGLQKISYSRSLHKELQLQVDFETVPLPNIEGLIFLNIPSWGSGADLWGSETDGRFRKPSIDDGLLEVVGVTGVVHMGQVQSGLRCGIRIAQGNYIRLTVSKEVPVQVDGEPWVQPPGHIIISAAGPKVRMLRKSKQKQKKHASGGKDTPLSSKDVGY